MANNIEDALTKVYDLIEKTKSEFETRDSKPTIHTFKDGAYLHYFDTWEEYFGGTLKKPIKTMGKYPKDKMPYMVYAKKGINIPLTSFPCMKTYVVIRGRVDFIFDDQEEIMEMHSFSTMVVEKGRLHGGMVREDTFLLICEEDID